VPSLRERLDRELGALSAQSRLREPTAARGLDFASNDYLGFASHRALAAAVQDALARGVPVGAGGSRLLRGNHPEHEALEAEAAPFFGAERAVYFGSGFDANLALFSTLPTRHGAVILDERVHASVKEGARAGFARKLASRHNDPASFDALARRARAEGARDLTFAVEGLYSMDGDAAPLRELAEIARRHEALLVVDEAHATGVLGARGRGAAEELSKENLVTLHTCGKALGASGALLCGPAPLVRLLQSTARPFLYSTAPSPLMAAVVRRALALLDEEPERRDRLRRLCALASELLPAKTGAPIVPVVLGDDARALEASRRLRDGGFDVRAVRPPTVPEGTARLRISINCERTPEELRALAAALREVLRA
jgi:8-amino-7-oxononanoate synthase